MFSYEIINKASFKFETKTIDTILKTICDLVEKKQNWTLNIVFLDDESIKNLNKKYRSIDKETDVLSFHYFEDFDKLKKDDIAWEIIMSEKKIIEQWEKYGLWSKGEFYKLIIHSVLHILWFDHEEDIDYKIMNKFENEIWNKVFGK